MATPIGDVLRTVFARPETGDFLLFFTDGIIEVEANNGSQLASKVCGKAFAPTSISLPSLCSMLLSVMFTGLAIRQS